MRIRSLLSAVCLALAASFGVGASVHAAAIDAPVTGKSSDTATANAASGNFSLAQTFVLDVRGGVGAGRRPRNDEVPLPGSGRRIPVSARDAAADTWQGCRAWTNRFKEPFQRCCRVDSRSLRSCYDQY